MIDIHSWQGGVGVGGGVGGTEIHPVNVSSMGHQSQ